MADSSGNGFNLVSSGNTAGLSLSSPPPSGFTSDAAHISDNAFRLLASDQTAFFSETMTLEATINLTDTTKISNIIGQGVLNATGGWGLVVSRTGDVSGSRELRFVYQLPGAVSWSPVSLESNVTLSANTTYYVAVAVDLSSPSATGATFYIQDLTNSGSLQTVTVSVGSTGLLNTSDALAIGFQNSATQYLGYVDNVRFSNTVLSEGQLLIAVPEPSTASLVAGCGALLVVGCMRRRRQH